MWPLPRLTLRVGGLATFALLVAACSAALAFSSPDPGRAEPPPRTPVPPTPDLGQVWPYVATPAPPGGSARRLVVSLLMDRPAAGEQVEVDAYYSGSGLVPHSRGPRPPRSAADCPCSWEAALTDRPFEGLLSILDGVHSNVLPDDEPWLVAVPIDAVWPGNQAVADLPYHARLRGYLSDPAFAHCSDYARIFVVMDVVQVYEAEPPATPMPTLPTDSPGWPRHRERQVGYSFPYPPGWQVEHLDAATVVLRAPQWAAWPILIRLHAGETHPELDGSGGLPTLLSGDSWGTYSQDQGQGGSGLEGYVVDRYTEPSERAVSVLFSENGYTYELALRYPLGFDALQPLLTAYTAVAEGFQMEDIP
jgi:hypothetical protein